MKEAGRKNFTKITGLNFKELNQIKSGEELIKRVEFGMMIVKNCGLGQFTATMPTGFVWVYYS